MSLKPCKFYDIRSGSPVLIGDYEAALEWLVKNPDVMANPFISKVRKSFQSALDKLGLKANVEFISDKEAEGIVGDSRNKFQIIGEKANLEQLEKDNLATAKKMESAGKDSKTIFLATGWEKGVDGKWKYEFGYNWVRKVRNNYEQVLPLLKKGTTLGEIFALDIFGNTPSFIKAYPELANVSLKENSNIEGMSFNPEKNRISIGSDIISDRDFAVNLAHEVQHAIQGIEGFARGGDPSMAFDDLFLYKERLKDLYGKDSKIYKEAVADLDENEKGITAFEIYRRLAGEVEARNTAARAQLTPEQRRSTPMSETEDLDRKKQVVLLDANNREQASSKPIKAQTAGFETRDGNPIGFNYDTDKVARERFDFSKLKKIGSGSDRDVYDLGNGKVLKVAKTARGLTQNIYEGDFYLKGIIPEVFERGLNYVVAENTPRIKTADVVETFDADGNVIGKSTAGEMLKELQKFSQKDMNNYDSKLQDVLAKYGLQDIMSYEVLWGDFIAQRNWGYKDGKAYHSDGGTFGGVDMIDSYKNKTNLSDPEFRKIYEESKRLKKQFGDTDKNTMYMRNAQGTILGFVQPQPDGSYKVWIDPATTDAETPIHELAGHIFMPLLKEAAPELHARGVELIQNTPYLKAAEALGLEGDAASEEALAQAIGEKGKQLSESKRPKFMEWLNGMWQKVGEKLGISVPIKNLTLGEFTDLIAGSVLEGDKLKVSEAKPATKEALKESIAANVAKLNIQLGDLFKSDNRLGLAKMPEQAARELYEQHKALVETLKKIISDVSQIAKLSAEEFADLLGQKATNLFKSAYNAFKTGKTSYNDFLEFNEIEIEKESKEQGELKERKTITSIKEASDISDDVKEALGGERTKYEVLPNEISVKEANAILAAMGESEAKALVLNGSGKIPGAFRTTLAQVLIKAYNAKGEYNNAVSVAEGIAELATDWGQAIQALSLFGYLTPEGQLLAAQRSIDNQVEKKFKEHKPKMDKLKKELKKANEEAIDEALDKVAGRVEETKKPVVPKRPLAYGEKNKIVTTSAYEKAKKGLKNFAFSGVPPELVTIAAYHVEAGARTFADFSKEMVKDFGKKVKPHLKAAYKAAAKQLGGTDYSNDQEIAKYFADNIDKDIAQAMKDSGIEIQKVIRSHYTEADAAKKTLTDKLIEKLGLDQSDADMIAKAVEVEFNKIATKKKEKAFATKMGPFMPKNPKTKTLQDKLIELSNLGAFTDETFKEAYAEAMEFPKLTAENAAEIKRLAEIVQDAKEGLPKFRATEDLLKYQANIKGNSAFEIGTAIWMASLLSGHITQVKNLAANTFNTTALLANAAAQNRNKRDIKFLLKGLAVGVKKGLLEARDVWDTGYSPIRDKAQVPSVLERVTFKGGKYNPFNYYKYVRRAMVAADVISFEGEKEMRAYQMALSKTKEGFPTNKQIDEALKILNATDDAIEISKQKALDEFNETKANIEARTDIDQAEKDRLTKQAAFDQKRRFYEFMEQARPEGLVSEAHDYAERGTFNNKPEGVLGLMADQVNQAIYRFPVGRFVVPFTNVIANVANETINYSPIGFWRAAKGGSISGNRKEFSEQQKLDLQYKAAMGVMGAAVVMALASIDDDEEDPMFQVTAGGYNDFAKNKDLAETGWQEYSIKIGDAWISYKLTPLLLMLSGIGAFKDYQRYRKGKVDDGTITRFGYAMRSALSTVTESTFLPSLNQFLDSLLDRSGQGKMDGLMEWGTKTALTFVPIFGTNAFQQSSQTIQNAFDVSEKEHRGTIFGRMLRNIPVARDMYQNVVNGLGEEQPPDIDVIFSTEREGPNEKLWNLLSKNKTTTGIPTIKGVTVLNKEGEEVSVNDKEFYLFARTRGEYIANTMNARYDELSKMEPKEFSKAMSKIKSDGTAYGKAVVESESYGKESEKLYLPVAQQIEAKLNPNKDVKKAFNEALESGNIEKAKKAFNKMTEKMPEGRVQGELADKFTEITNQNPIQNHSDEVASVVYGLMDDATIIQGDTVTTVRKLYSESELAFFKKKMDDFSKKQAKKVEVLDSIRGGSFFTEYFMPYNKKFGGELTETPVVKKQPSLTERTMKNLKILFK